MSKRDRSLKSSRPRDEVEAAKIALDLRPHALYEIYCPDSPGVGSYVGISVEPLVRWSTHKRTAQRNGGWTIHKAMRKYGIENFSIRIVLWYPRRYMAAQAEIQFIATGRYGYNESPGGDGGTGLPLSPEALKRISILNSRPRGPMPEHQKKAIADANRGRKQGPPSEETRCKISATKKGIPKSEEFKRQVAITLKGKPKSKEAIKKTEDAQRGIRRSPAARENMLSGSAA